MIMRILDSGAVMLFLKDMRNGTQMANKIALMMRIWILLNEYYNDEDSGVKNSAKNLTLRWP